MVADVRTFIATDIDPAIIARLAALQDVWRAAGAPVAWVRPTGMHLTLKFLGNVPEERLPTVADILTAVAQRHTPFNLTLAGTGGFPNLRRPRVLWVGVTEGAAELAELAREVDDELAALGFPREARPFSPHLTLGRVKAPERLEELRRQVEAQGAEQFGTMRVEGLTFYRSDLSPQGARYTVLRMAPFTPESSSSTGLTS
ncbi:MAG TPA: RNA 2',3'-cyclic phosphodiesterase [Armatimonadota bacterium]|jgi:2'-5' RNA ligase